MVECSACPLRVNGYCKPEKGALYNGIFLVGQNPGSTEVKINKPFSGPCSWIFDYLNRSHYFITNIVKCAGDVKKCLYCSDFMTEVASLKPRVIITLGAIPFTRITGHRPEFGRTQYWNTIPVFPCYHPSGANNGNRAALIKQLLFVRDAYE